mmetsp:Transcript_10572/g.25779  ORF Transcript_10572/g.25779 Transcript_10572/m.25779 type:complete len:242 (+) Transcript_10572:175-900(+)|eukprot:g1817.t1
MGNRQSCTDKTGKKDAQQPQLPAPPPPPKKKNTNETDRAILKLKLQRDDLQKQKRKMATLVSQEAELVKEKLRNKQKQVALFHLKRKNIHEKQILSCENALLKLLELIDNVEMTRIQANVLNAMKEGNSVLKKLKTEIGGVERIAEIMEETEEFREWNEEVNTLMSQHGIAEEDVDAELAMIEEEEAIKAFSDVKPVPSHEPAPQAELAASATIGKVDVEGVVNVAIAKKIPVAVPEMVPA